MALIKNGRFVEDNWVTLDDEAALGAAGDDIIVSLARWRSERRQLLRRGGRLGLRLTSDQSPALVEDDLNCFDLIALDFPAFKDGRAFSYARILRERHGFAGELRATGDILRDQLFFMHRCGFDAYEVADDSTIADWQDALAEISVFYQPATDKRRSVLELRHRRSNAAG